MNLFAPDHFVDHAGVALDELDNLGGYTFINIVGYREAEVTIAIHLYCYIHGLQQRVLVDTGKDEVALVECLGSFGGCAYADSGNRLADAQEEAAFFGQRA